MKEFKSTLLHNRALPLVIEPTDQRISLAHFLSLLHEESGSLKERLLQHGGLLFRNCPLQEPKDFAAAIRALGLGDFIDYIGGDSPRIKVIDGVYTSTEAPPSIKIALHNELSYVKNHPKHIYFYCMIPPLIHGETIISDARKACLDIHPSVKKRFLEKGILYISRYPAKHDFIRKINKSHKPWSDVFETEDKKEVERKCKENGFSFTWHGNDWLEIRQVRPALTEHPITQEQVWFNQAHLFDFNARLLGMLYYLAVRLVYFRKNTLLHEVFFGDGTPIPKKDLVHILDILDQNTIYFPWQKNDMLVLDNVLSMHGRATFTGKRRVLTAMTG